ncbi:metal ABC transporter solute-binding protein, Zn/Mn family [Bacillus sp. T33-2]|uniref:metal ABC transporter solute-binding protein, Zn/Mn family n=1 Tax=Bacillus sp. T33-2 TaxID=2054168 RepID=UPI000C78F2A1|nr:zinc ABC transporter substrate-binding protein [Bacillus sp. T33-2]PLR98250.1 adhesin [Bacillus sp. T33-2]
MKKIKVFMTLLLSLSLFLSGCTEQKSEKKVENETLQVYTTVYPLQYFTDRIGGKFVAAETIYPPGADEHTFEPSQKDMMKLADSDLFIYVGLGLEGFVDKTKETLKNEDTTMLAAGENVQFTEAGDDHNDSHAEGEHEHGEQGHVTEGEHKHGEEGHADEGEEHSHEDGHNHDGIDPHVWLDPVYAKDLAEAIKDGLTEKMPEQKQVFKQNFEDLSAELDDLNNDFLKMSQSAARKEIIVSHAAFGYWEKRYGIEQVSVSGMSSSDEPSQKELQSLIDHANERGIKYVLFEQNVSSKLAESVQKQIRAERLSLHNLSTLTDDNIKQNETYFTLMNKNVEILQIALNQ